MAAAEPLQMAVVPWWREPTKDQWYAWGGRVARVDARRLRLHPVPVDHRTDCRRISRAGAGGRRRVDDRAVDAAAWRHRQWPARRPDRPQDAVDDRPHGGGPRGLAARGFGGRGLGP